MAIKKIPRESPEGSSPPDRSAPRSTERAPRSATPRASEETESPVVAATGPDDREILEERGEVEQNLIEIAARDTAPTAEDEHVLAREIERKPDTFYSDLIYTLANIRYPESEARLVWENILKHK
ncbi:MAG: hypothetical protein ACYTAF_16315, partial [Planctomycetota bacterium]